MKRRISSWDVLNLEQMTCPCCVPVVRVELDKLFMARTNKSSIKSSGGVSKKRFYITLRPGKKVKL
jgi:hypothetical protein